MRNRKVNIETGELQGIFGYDPRITVFKGVPYAAPPVGKLRWCAPQPAPKWEGVRMADQYKPMACQPVPGSNPEEFWTREIHPTGPEFDMSEDCLYLNVFTPARVGDEKLPVLFYIHGGGYKGGYPYEVEFDWEHMSRKGIVVVAVTYRLGVMGFLATPELSAEQPEAPKGNYGILDQLFGLQWTKRNIAAFGGDPDRITIAGQSAGAGSVQCLLTSPLSVGLISGAIIQSAVAADFTDMPGRKNTLADAEKIGADFFNKAGITSLEEARKIAAKDLLRLEDELLGPGIRFEPNVDNILLKETAFEAYMKNHHHKVPVLAGYNRGETEMFTKFFSNAPKNMEEFNSFAKGYGESETQLRALCHVENDQDVRRLFNMDAFIGLIAGTRMFGYIQNQQGRKSYLYEFDPDIPGEDNAGSYHGCELWFAYDSLARSWRPFKGKHYDLARQTSSYWANFVKTGDPNGMDTIGEPLPEWKPFTEENQFIMGFKDVPAKMDTVTDPLMKLRIDLTLCSSIDTTR
jgi:para-nitrobenzyl esterase